MGIPRIINGKSGKQLQSASKPVRRKAGQRANLTRQAIIVMACQMLEAGRPVNVLKLAQALNVVPATIKSHYPGGHRGDFGGHCPLGSRRYRPSLSAGGDRSCILERAFHAPLGAFA